MTPQRAGQLAMVVAATLFGLATLVAGARVWFGKDPGYVVFRPLLVFNSLMGFAYLLAAYGLWRSVWAGAVAAGAIFALNLLVLAAVAWLHSEGQPVAIDSVRAMLLRTGVWLVIAAGALWLSRGNAAA